MTQPTFQFQSKVEVSPAKGGWHYAHIPGAIMELLKPYKKSSFLKGTASVGKSSWQATIMAMGEGRYMLPLKSEIRSKESLKLDDKITIKFTLEIV